MRLNPVDVPNIRQNTPNEAALKEQLQRDEQARQSVDFDEALADLVAQLQGEKQLLKPNRQGSAEK